MSQMTLDGVSIPISAREPKKDLTPVQYKIWRHLRTHGPKTRLEIQNHISFKEIATIGNRLRELKPKYVRKIPQKNGSILWEAI